MARRPRRLPHKYKPHTLDTGARLAGSEVEDGEGGEASQRPTQRPVPSATVTLATLSDEDDEEEDLGAPPPK